MGDLDIQRVSLELGALPDVDLSKLLQPWVERSIQATPEIFLGEGESNYRFVPFDWVPPPTMPFRLKRGGSRRRSIAQ